MKTAGSTISVLKYEIRTSINKSGLDLSVVELVLDSIKSEVMTLEITNLIQTTMEGGEPNDVSENDMGK